MARVPTLKRRVASLDTSEVQVALSSGTIEGFRTRMLTVDLEAERCTALQKDCVHQSDEDDGSVEIMTFG